MGQHEYGVELAAKPDEMKRIALAFKAGQQKERDSILQALDEISSKAGANEALGVLVWSKQLSERLGLDDKVV
jgi:hypothetical protein